MEVKDSGSLMNRVHSAVADKISIVLGQRVNYILRYYSNRHRFPNLSHPKDLSERILSAMLSKEFLKYADYADKVKVRDYIAYKGLESILLKQYGAWENAKEIPFCDLPDKFILKANNGSGGHVICTDKSRLDVDGTIEKMNNVLKGAEHLRYTEPHYCAIKPMILCEELLGDGKLLPTDYKFTCVKGKIADIFVVNERENGAKYSTMDTNWNVLPYTKKEFMPSSVPPKPKHLEEMIEIAKILSSDFEFVRVDLYDSEDGIFFSELTFSPWGGIMNSYTNEAIKTIGNMFDDHD